MTGRAESCKLIRVDGGNHKAMVSAELGLDERYDPWLAEIDVVTPAAPELDPPLLDDVGTILSQLGCSDASVADAVRTFPTPKHDPARWWLLDRCRRRLAAAMGDVDVVLGSWPDLPPHLGLAGYCFPLHLFAVATPAIRIWHATKGVPNEVSSATLADLSRHDAIGRRAPGTSAVDSLSWFKHHLRGMLFEVEGLQYRMYRLGGPDQPEPWLGHHAALARGPGFLPGDLCVSFHIPEGAVIDEPRVQSSMAAARDLLVEVFPKFIPRIVTGSSWMLDDQLLDLVPSDSTIVRLQQTFQLVPGWLDGDSAILRSVFAQWGERPLSGAPRTRLQQAVLSHLSAGGHFRWRTGWRRLPAS